MAGRSWGTILSALWFILTGLLAITNFSFDAAPLIMGVLAIAAGVCLLLGK